MLAIAIFRVIIIAVYVISRVAKRPLFRFERSKTLAKSKITSLIESYMAEISKSQPYELSRCEFVKEGSTWYLRVYVDKLADGIYGYMSSDDCEVVSRLLSAKLDADDPIEQNYYLEVSSPGLDRPLLSEKDFKRFLGEAVEVHLYKAQDGKKDWEGSLASYEESSFSITLATGETKTFNKQDVSKVNLAVIF